MYLLKITKQIKRNFQIIYLKLHYFSQNHFKCSMVCHHFEMYKHPPSTSLNLYYTLSASESHPKPVTWLFRLH